MNFKNLVAPVVFGALSLAVADAYADNTEAGVTIQNTATLTYDVNTVAQTPVTAVDNVLVDAKVDLTLERTDNTPSTTAAGDLIDLGGVEYYVIGEFKLKNTGNADSYFTFSATNNTDDQAIIAAVTGNNKNTANGDSDFAFFIEDGTNSSGLDSSDTALSGLANNELKLAKDLSSDQIIYVVANAASVQGSDEDLFGVDLTARVSAVDFLRTDGSTADRTEVTSHNGTATANGRTFSFVFADAGNDAQQTAADLLKASFPDLGNGDGGPNPNDGNFTKTSVVISDPINTALAGGAANPDAKAIPGAVVEYTITIKNTGSADAGNVVITDPIPANTTFIANTIQAFQADGSTALAGATLNFDAGNNEVVVGLGTLDGGTAAEQETNIIKFRVTID